MKKYCINDTDTIKEVISIFEGNNDRAVVVINKTKKVIGIISEGDIIRALSDNVDLYTPIKTILHSSFLYLNDRNMEKAYTYFKTKYISLLPIVNRNFEFLDVITINDIYNYLEDKYK